jgi:hypothetical protein
MEGGGASGMALRFGLRFFVMVKKTSHFLRVVLNWQEFSGARDLYEKSRHG